ncbi:MAG: type III pantothenate kinase [Desulfovibrio sp.]|nr:type III pantothenate kinase [Desulfovibrio sp.]
MRYRLYLDIGNTNTKIGIGDGEKLRASFALPSDERRTADEFGLSLVALLRLQGLEAEDIEGGLACSVSPGISKLVRDACLRFLGKTLLFAPEDVPVPLENRYALPHEVGADRLVGAYAARRLFPEVFSLISVDYGTATTFDCVEGDAYLGGLICPGVLSSIAALTSRTAKLQGVSLEVESAVPAPGISTATSLKHGFVFGFAAMTEGLCERLAAGMRGPVAVVGTGGFASVIARVTRRFDAVLPDMLLDGLRLLYNERITG